MEGGGFAAGVGVGVAEVEDRRELAGPGLEGARRAPRRRREGGERDRQEDEDGDDLGGVPRRETVLQAPYGGAGSGPVHGDCWSEILA